MKQLLAALDIGSNTVLLLTAHRQPDGALVEDQEFCRTTRLGENTGKTGKLQQRAMTRTLAAIAEFLERVPRDCTTGRGIAAATSAVRDADNRSEFLRECEKLLAGGTPLVLTGHEEALTVFRGAASDLPADEFVVNIDIGGGSTEIAAGYPAQCLFSVSLNLGCVRFGERFQLYEVPTTEAVEAARQAMAELLKPVCTEVGGLQGKKPCCRLITSGGTATTYAAMRLALARWDRTAVHGFADTADDLGTSTSRLFGMPSAERSLLPGVSPGRAPVLPTGMLILSETLRLLGASEFTVTTRGLRFGLALRMEAGELSPTWTW